MSRLLLKSANLIQSETVSFIKCGPYWKSSFIKRGGCSLITFIKCDIIGLIGVMAGVPQQILLDGDSLFTHFKGALTEQYVLNEMIIVMGMDNERIGRDRAPRDPCIGNGVRGAPAVPTQCTNHPCPAQL